MFRTICWVAALCAGCSEFDLKSDPDKGDLAAPDILVTPTSLTYGRLSTAEQEIQTFEVQNVGGATLNVSDIVFASGIAFTIVSPDTTFDLEPGASTTVDVAFSPMGADENFGRALVLSDDPDSPEVGVDLLGYGAVPELQISPDSYVFGETFVPCGASVTLELENVGSEDLIITDYTYTSAGLLTLDGAAFRASLPLTLAPGEITLVDVDFAAATAGADTGMLEVVSNDPRGVVTADQNGEGSYADSRVETFTEPLVPPVDVMMLIDQSGSMSGDNTDDVEAGMGPFLAELNALADWQLIQVTEQDGCANGGILTPAVPNAETLLIDFAFGTNDHDLTEALLELAAVALSKTGVGQCNEGFLRPGALLHIIAISDEPEQSGELYLQWLAEYTAWVPAEQTIVSAVVDLTDCGDGGEGYIEAAAASGGITLDICDNSWGTGFSIVASEGITGGRTYGLAAPPDPSSVVVTIDGVPTTDVTVAGSDVTVNSPEVTEGAVVEITYGVLSECP